MHVESHETSEGEKSPVHRRRFTKDEDLKLRSLVESLGPNSWDEIAGYFPGRCGRQCRDRYKNYLVDSLVTVPWTAEEDRIVIQKFHQIGPKWVEIGKVLRGRSGNSVKNRWHKRLCKLDDRPPPPERPKPEPPNAEAPKTEASKPRAPPEEKRLVDLAQLLGISDGEWPPLFAPSDPNSVPPGSWSSGSSIGDPLF
jgi:hypothetical protein